MNLEKTLSYKWFPARNLVVVLNYSNDYPLFHLFRNKLSAILYNV